MAVLLYRGFVERGQPLVEPGWTIGKIGSHEGVDNLMHQRAASGLDVHDEGMIGRGVIAKPGSRRVVEKKLRVVRVTGAILENPDVDNLLGVIPKVILF